MNGDLESMTPAEYMENRGEGYRVLDAAQAPSIPNAKFVDVAKVHGLLEDVDKDEKLMIICTKSKRAYMLQQRLKYFGYTDTTVVEGGLWFNEPPVKGK